MKKMTKTNWCGAVSIKILSPLRKLLTEPKEFQSGLPALTNERISCMNKQSSET